MMRPMPNAGGGYWWRRSTMLCHDNRIRGSGMLNRDTIRAWVLIFGGLAVIWAVIIAVAWQLLT